MIYYVHVLALLKIFVYFRYDVTIELHNIMYHYYNYKCKNENVYMSMPGHAIVVLSCLVAAGM